MKNYVEVNLGHIAENCQNLKKAVGGTKILVVLSANAYGHGIVEVAKTAARVGADFLGVDSVEDGLMLRKNKVTLPILVFGRPDEDLLVEAVTKDLSLTVFDLEMVKKISHTGLQTKKPAKVHVKVETGLCRYGILENEISAFFDHLKHTPKIEIEGVYSTFAAAENRDKSYTFKQLGTFQKITDVLRHEGYEIPLTHIANSAAALSMSSTHFNMVRVGLTVYGLFPNPELGSFFELKPALTWKSRIISLKKLSGGEKIGFSGACTTTFPIKVAVIPVGYSDGIDRRLSNIAKVLVRGKRALIVGKVSMCDLMVDVSQVEDVALGDEVVLIGKQESEQITAGELAGLLGTINYEIVSRISPAIPRVYVR